MYAPAGVLGMFAFYRFHCHHSSIQLTLILCREKRQNFIRLKYIDRQFSIPEDSSDKEIVEVMKNRPPGEGEDELFNDSAEV